MWIIASDAFLRNLSECGIIIAIVVVAMFKKASVIDMFVIILQNFNYHSVYLWFSFKGLLVVSLKGSKKLRDSSDVIAEQN